MMLALVNGQRSYAEPKQVARCPACGGDAIPKCGRINVWHWAHKTLDCDTFAEAITQWHVDWQTRYPRHMREVVIGAHRADVLLPNGCAIEFQHSSLSVDEIREREDYYGSMLWVFDTVDAYENDRLNLRRKRAGHESQSDRSYRSFRWKHPRRSLLHCRRPVFLDLGGGNLLELKRLYPNAPYGGWGFLLTIDMFLARCGMEFTFT